MRRRLFSAAGLLCGLVGIVLVTHPAEYAFAAPDCDDQGVSGSTKNCAGMPQGKNFCSSYVSSALCSNTQAAIQLKDDFPKSCVSKKGSNCDQVLAQCWQSVTCRWIAGTSTCEVDPNGTFGTWQTAEKNVQSSCDPPDPG